MSKSFLHILYCLLLIGLISCQEEKSTMTGSYCSMSPRGLAISFSGDTIIYYQDYGEPYRKYLYKIEGGQIMQGKYIDEGYYVIVPPPPVDTAWGMDIPPVVPPRGIIVDSSKLDEYRPVFDIMYGVSGDTVLSHLPTKNHPYFQNQTALRLCYLTQNPFPIRQWKQIEMDAGSFQLIIQAEGIYHIRWTTGDRKGQMLKGSLSKEWLAKLDAFLIDLEGKKYPKCSLGGSHGPTFWLSISRKRFDEEYYFESHSFPPPLRAITSILAKLAMLSDQLNTTEEEIEFTEYFERISSLCD